ncbi:MAG TPA: hypothetical protein ENI08_03405 [Candidatus Dependentiae bacterium]|nr:hypothetical protein [Candidatus Dependentiae bacterium]
MAIKFSDGENEMTNQDKLLEKIQTEMLKNRTVPIAIVKNYITQHWPKITAKRLEKLAFKNIEYYSASEITKKLLTSMFNWEAMARRLNDE